MGVKKFNEFSEEVLMELRKNSCIARIVNGYLVEFNSEFQELACQELLKGKKTMREILRDHGINPELLGNKRIWNFSHRLRAKGESGCQPEQVNIMKRSELCNNPYVLSVINDRIHFTEEFKELVCKELLKGEKNMREILEYFGFDTQLLGESRITKFAAKMRKRCAQLSEKQHGIANIPNCYNASQKRRDEHKELLTQTRELATEKFKTEVEHNGVTEINTDLDTAKLQKSFTAEERESLLNNPYVANVTDSAVQFTEEFKESAYQEYLQNRKTMREILQEHGIAPEILGSKRIWNFTSKLQEKAKKLQGFGDARTHNRRRPKNPTEEKTLTERIRVLEHELAYTRQEVEFLKKTQMVDMEARRAWESKHRQK